jgi:multiple sugar transport system permease protein
MRAKDARQVAKGLAFLSPWLIGFLAFTLLPIVLAFYYSFCEFSLLKAPLFVGADNYRELVRDEVFWRSMRNTLYYASIALPAGLLVSLGLALLLNVNMPGQALFRTIIFLPSLAPVVASAMLWLWLFNARLGLINTALAKLHLTGPGWLTDPSWAMPALVLMSLWGVGHTIVIYLAGLQDVPRDLYEAAELDGAGLWGRMWHVTLPMLSPVIFFNLIMAIIGVIQVFDVPYIMTQGGPARATYFISMYLRDRAFMDLRMGYASAIAAMMFLLVLVLTGMAFWTSGRWVHYERK